MQYMSNETNKFIIANGQVLEIHREIDYLSVNKILFEM